MASALYILKLSFSKLARILQSNWLKKKNPHLRLDITYPPAKFDVDGSKETQVIIKKTNVWLKTTIFSKLARILQSNWSQKQSHLCLDMIHPPAKFDVDWSKETQVIVKKLMFDARPPTDILILITRFHLVKT